MTKTQFIIECGKRLIDPEIALENENIKHCLETRDDEKILEVLDEEF